MKLITNLPAPAGYVSGKTHALWRYLERLADGWEYARDEDIQVLERLLDDLERELRHADEDALPPVANGFLAAARRAAEQARASRADARMQYLEAAREAAEALLDRLPADV